MIKITSDGTASGTRVTGQDGVPLKGITKIEILPIEPDGIVRAAVTFSMAHLEIEAIRQAAEQYVEPQHPAEAMGFDAWMRQRTEQAHAAYMERHAAGGTAYPATIPMSFNGSAYMRRTNTRKHTLAEVCKWFGVPVPAAQ